MKEVLVKDLVRGGEVCTAVLENRACGQDRSIYKTSWRASALRLHHVSFKLGSGCVNQTCLSSQVLSWWAIRSSLPELSLTTAVY